MIVAADSTWITLKLSPCLENGGSSLLSYTLYRDQGDYLPSYTSIYTGSFLGEYKVIGLTPGKQYRFKTTVTNAIGESDFSAEVAWYSAALPSKPAPLSRGPLTTRNQL